MTDLVSNFLWKNQNEKQGWLCSLENAKCCFVILCGVVWSPFSELFSHPCFSVIYLSISPLLKKLFSRFWSSFSSICWSYFFFDLSGIAGYSGDFDVISTITSVQHTDFTYVTRIKQAKYPISQANSIKVEYLNALFLKKWTKFCQPEGDYSVLISV